MTLRELRVLFEVQQAIADMATRFRVRAERALGQPRYLGLETEARQAERCAREASEAVREAIDTLLRGIQP